MGEISNKPESQTLKVPAFGDLKSLGLDITQVVNAERRFLEAKNVNPATYTDLEHSFNEAYRALRKHSATLMYRISQAERKRDEARAAALIDRYPEFMEDKPKSRDSADMRKSFLARDEDYIKACEYLSTIETMSEFVEGRMKTLENVCRYMRKKMDLLIRSGAVDKYTL